MPLFVLQELKPRGTVIVHSYIYGLLVKCKIHT